MFRQKKNKDSRETSVGTSIPNAQARSLETSQNNYNGPKGGQVKNCNHSSIVDLKNVLKLSPLLLANIPNEYTIEDVFYLVEERSPEAFSEISTTNRMNLRFCEIYFKSEDDVMYLKGKLDGFQIRKKKLIATTPSELFECQRWFF